MPKQFHVLITGASKGIGKATALYLDKQGYYVIAGVRKPADADTLRAAATDRLTTVMIDVTEPDMIAAVAQQVAEITGEDGLYGLVNNAGVAIASPLELFELDAFRQQFEINLFGQLAVTQAMLPYIRKAQGRIINMSSIGGKSSTAFLGAYNATKHALEAVSDVLRLELQPWNIEVVSILPGAIQTPIWETAQQTATQLRADYPAEGAALYDKISQRFEQAMMKTGEGGIPPERVAEVVLQALTATRPQARYLVGNDARMTYYGFRFLPERLKARLFYRVMGQQRR